MKSALLEILLGRSEDLGIEYKAWMDTSVPDNRAKLARHIAALANHGGGYLIFGVDDTTRLPQGASELSDALFTQDAINSIVKKYLEPRIQVRLEEVENLGIRYPVFIVPSHGPRPVIAIADGPQDARRQPVGVRQGEIYIRAAGPESVCVRTQDNWNALLDRCLAQRADLLGNILRQTISRPSKPDVHLLNLLLSAAEATAVDFIEQVSQVASQGHQQLAFASDHFSILSYALVDANGDLLHFDGLRAKNDQVGLRMREKAFNGWASFISINVQDRAPQLRYRQVDGAEITYLEGMRIGNSNLLGGSVDYWRIYERGIATIAESYREDSRGPCEDGIWYLTVCQIVFRIHSLLAHARITGQLSPGGDQVVVRLDWRGLTGRRLQWDQHRVVSPGLAADDRFVKTITLPWSDLRDHYGETLRRTVLPVLEIFPSVGWGEPSEWLTREMLKRELDRIGMSSVSLFDD